MTPRIPVEIDGERVTGMYMRYRKDGTAVFEAMVRINGKVTRRMLHATEVRQAAAEIKLLQNTVRRPLGGRGRRAFAYKHLIDQITLPVETLVRILISLGSNSGNYVYVVSDGDFIKIGHSAKPRHRINGLQTGSARKLEVLALIRGGGKLEQALHDIFATHRQRGEWFRASEEMFALIRALGLVTETPDFGNDSPQTPSVEHS